MQGGCFTSAPCGPKMKDAFRGPGRFVVSGLGFRVPTSSPVWIQDLGLGFRVHVAFGVSGLWSSRPFGFRAKTQEDIKHNMFIKVQGEYRGGCFLKVGFLLPQLLRNCAEGFVQPLKSTLTRCGSPQAKTGILDTQVGSTEIRDSFKKLRPPKPLPPHPPHHHPSR